MTFVHRNRVAWGCFSNRLRRNLVSGGRFGGMRASTDPINKSGDKCSAATHSLFRDVGKKTGGG